MEKLQHDLLTTKFTEVWHEDEKDMKFNAPNHFVVTVSENLKPGELETMVCKIDFQEGPIKECGVNGVGNEDVISMVICRLEHFQKSEFACRENALAVTKLEEALLWLRKRTIGREQRGVDGMYTV